MTGHPEQACWGAPGREGRRHQCTHKMLGPVAPRKASLCIFSRRAFLKQNAFVLANIPYVCVSCSVMFNSVTPWTIGHQAPLSMECSRQEYWSGLQFPSLRDLPHPGSNTGVLHCRQTLPSVTRDADTSRESSPPLRLILGRFLG